MNSGTLEGKVAIVTGGGKGFGYGIARKLIEHGADVLITGRDENALRKTSEEINSDFFKADVTSENDWNNLCEKVMNQHGRIDIMVNNAGSGGDIKELDSISFNSINQTIAVNLTGTILGCRMAAGIMKKQKSGTIINISSTCARQAWPGWSVYSAAKAGVVQMSKCLYVELRQYNVRVTTVIPSWGATGFLENANLPAFDSDTASRSISPENIGDQIVSICTLPEHLVIQDITLLPLVQEINPL